MSGRAVGTLLVALLVLSACRDGAPAPAPSPSPTASATTAPSPVSGLRVGVVLPPSPLRSHAEVDAMRDDLEDLAERFGDDVASLRIVQPDGPSFITDVTDLLADRGADLVCVIGPGAGVAVRTVAPRYPGTEFCAAPTAGPEADIPPNVLLVDVRVEELTFLAGVAAQLADPAAERPPGFVAGDSQYAVDRRRAAFAAGLGSVAPRPVVPYVGGPAADEERGYALAAPQFEAGVPVIHTVAQAGDLGVLRAAEESGRLVIGSRHTLVPHGPEGTVGTPSTAVLMTVDVVVAAPVEAAIQRALESWVGGQASVGLAEGAFEIGAGGSPRYRAIAGAVEDARARLVTGELSPLPVP